MTVYVLTSSFNDYDQHGDYFVEVFHELPSLDTLYQVIKNDPEKAYHHELFEEVFNVKRLKHIQNGGGRIEWENQWYTLIKRETK